LVVFWIVNRKPKTVLYIRDSTKAKTTLAS
jgi:hypothetical protein